MSQGESSLVVGVPKESFPGENRVALVPAMVALLKKGGFEILIEAGAGTAAGFVDEAYVEQGAKLVSRSDVFNQAQLILAVRAAGGNPEAGQADIDALSAGQTLVAALDPLTEPKIMAQLAEKGVNCYSLELLPRITRAQSMDILSSMATIAGYKAVLMAANTLPRLFPMMMTAAGTLTPAKVLVIGAGVAGLQAIASSKRLGAVVFGYDIRPAVKEEVESLGGKFVELKLETGDSEQSGGYAKAMGDDFYKKQQELLGQTVMESDVVISTAAVPGKQAPKLITAEMVAGMAPGTVIVDIAAERGGNCVLTKPGETVVEHGVTILGPANLPSTIPQHASQMFAKNITTFVQLLVKDGAVQFTSDDEILRETQVTYNGEVVNNRVRELLELPPLNPPAEEEPEPAADAAASGEAEK